MAEQHGSKIYLLHVIAEHIQQCAADYCLSTEMVKQLEKGSLKAAKDKLKKEADAIVKSRKSALFLMSKPATPLRSFGVNRKPRRST